MAVELMKSRHIRIGVLLIGLIAYSALSAEERTQPKALDSKLYKQRCLMCHSTSPPEGIAASVVAGIVPKKPPNGADTAAALRASPLQCWRRCTKCWPN